MYTNFKSHLEKELQDIKDAGLYKNERIITSPQKAGIRDGCILIIPFSYFLISAAGTFTIKPASTIKSGLASSTERIRASSNCSLFP